MLTITIIITFTITFFHTITCIIFFVVGLMIISISYVITTTSIILLILVWFSIWCHTSLWQVANGLHYLHKNKVLYRDLKSDNVLICSLDPSDDINVKISDYGISKFATPQGMMGMVGTPGYMAPEIMYGQAYDEKVSWPREKGYRLILSDAVVLLLLNHLALFFTFW